MGENNISASCGGSSTNNTNGAAHSPQQPVYTADYLSQLLKDKKQLNAFPNMFVHLDRLVDEEINRTRHALFQLDSAKSGLDLPDPDGIVQTSQEKVYVPVKSYPDYNFVGRILGPRGMTAKQLEQETGCKIMVRGRGSMRDKKKEEQNRGKPNWEHLNEDLHVLITCEDTENRAKVKLERAVEEIRKLLVPAFETTYSEWTAAIVDWEFMKSRLIVFGGLVLQPEGEDDLKRKQLMELAIINGTYRPANQGGKGGVASQAAVANSLSFFSAAEQSRLLGQAALQSPLRSPSLGAPIILSPTRLAQTPPVSLSANSSMSSYSSINGLNLSGLSGINGYGGLQSLVPTSQNDLNLNAATAGLFYRFQLDSLDPLTAAAAAAYPFAFSSPLQFNAATANDYAGLEQAGALLNTRRLLSAARDHPYQRSSLQPPTA